MEHRFIQDAHRIGIIEVIEIFRTMTRFAWMYNRPEVFSE